MYKGVLYYEGEDNHLTVHRFIERDDGAAIHLTTTWDDGGEWSVDAVAKRVADSYVTDPLHPMNKIGKPSAQCAVVSLTVVSRHGSEIKVVGSWSESGDEYKFEGDLTHAA